MQHYYKIENLPIYTDLMDHLIDMLGSKVIDWGNYNQICINTTESEPDNYHLGAGSLHLDWGNKSWIDNHGITSVIVKQKNNKLLETDFTRICSQFTGTIFEKIYHDLQQNYRIGRLRLMKSNPSTCLSWHRDRTPRIHYPVKTQLGCKMVVEDQSFHLSQNNWWWVNTTLFHTAFNGSKEDRIHIVGEIIN